MSHIKIIILTLFVFKTSFSMGQDLTAHKWNNRILLVIVNNLDNSVYNNQIGELQACIDGLLERKLLVYHIKKDRYKLGLENSVEWKKSPKLYKKYKKTTSDFEILLIGLDGGIKLRQESILDCKNLFGIIDIMPMRKAEMRGN